MKRIRKDIEISDLIYKSLRGETSKSEDELLEAWCLEPRNRKLFMELREADHLYEGVADISPFIFCSLSNAVGATLPA